MDTNRIYHEIVKEILELVESGAFAVGSRLPSERELALKFGVSRACIREAQIVLEAQGRLKVKAGSGAYVFDEDEAPSSYFPPVSCFELVEAHTLFEAEVVALAAPLITDETILELERLPAIIVGKVKDKMTPDEAVATFYNVIARATNNRVIMFMIQTMWEMKPDDQKTYPNRQAVYSQVSRYIEDEYYMIINALKKRDSTQARQAVQGHFTRIMKALLEASEVDAYQEMKRQVSETRSRFLLSAQLS